MADYSAFLTIRTHSHLESLRVRRDNWNNGQK